MYTEKEVKAIDALYELFGVKINNKEELNKWKENFLS